MAQVRSATLPAHSTLSSIEDWFHHQSRTLDWRQRELDYAYGDHYRDSDHAEQKRSANPTCSFSADLAE
nr:hypothetical protein BaRGS_006757 [Batillaria attramentaria]